jgi:DNA-3-methyladenine glycosylase
VSVVGAEHGVDAGRGPPSGRLEREFFARPVEQLAMALLGMSVVRSRAGGDRSVGRIVEVEAYGGPDDRASHARSGRTRRNATMFGEPGHAYIYRVYGLHTCLNIVGNAPGSVGAVLVRAVMPLGDLSAIRRRRDRPGRRPMPEARLASGPGNVGAAFDIGLELDGVDLTAAGPLWLELDENDIDGSAVEPASRPSDVMRGPRIGVEYAGPGWADAQLRFALRGEPAISRPFPPGS